MRAILVALLMMAVVAPVVSHAAVDEDEAVKACLKKWKKAPFNAEDLNYRTIQTKVKVMGIGGNVKDDTKTQGPELVLVKPGVSVMAKTVYDLDNPNGWYCLKGKVSVLGAIQINLACNAQIASSGDDVAVLGGSDKQSGGVSVLGSVRIARAGCNN